MKKEKKKKLNKTKIFNLNLSLFNILLGVCKDIPRLGVIHIIVHMQHFSLFLDSLPLHIEAYIGN